jgi:hypothetical protein
LWRRVMPLLLDSFFFLFFHFPWSYGPSITSRSCNVLSPGDWLVSSIWFLLSTGQVAIRTWSSSLLVHARCSEMSFLPGGSCVGSSPSNLWQFSFEYHPQPYWPAQGSTSTLLWEVGLSPHPGSQNLLFFFLCSLRVWILAPPPSLGQFQCSTPPLLLVLDCNSLFMLSSFVLGRIQSTQGLHYIMFPEGG